MVVVIAAIAFASAAAVNSATCITTFASIKPPTTTAVARATLTAFLEHCFRRCHYIFVLSTNITVSTAAAAATTPTNTAITTTTTLRI